MSADFNSISAQAMSLPTDQRYVLAQQLYESVEGQIDADAELIAEFDRRCAEMDSGAVETFSHEEVMRDAKNAIGQ